MEEAENKNTASTAEQSAEVSTQDVQNDLQELIAASAQPVGGSEKIDFSVSSDQKEKEENKAKAVEARKVPKKTLMMAGYALIVFALCAMVYVVYGFFTYTMTGSVTPVALKKYMPKMQMYYLTLLDGLGISEPYKYTSNALLVKDLKKNEVVSKILADPDLEYVAKKKFLEEGVESLFAASNTTYTSLDALKTEVGQQGYFPRDIKAIAPGVFFDNSLQKAIISIESVRFTTALKFFSILDSFVGQLSSYTSTDKTILANDLEGFIDRGEKDINNYIASCYLNGYESSSDCSTIGDFTNYYSVLGVTGFDQRVFLQTMNALEAKLENTDFPSLDIAMQSIDPLKNTITLRVEINTFKEDEAQLTASQGILNPHIFIVTSIINHLRESRFVLTDSINVDSLNVIKKKIKVGGQVVSVNSSSFSFSLPLQNQVQREIYDFADPSTQK